MSQGSEKGLQVLAICNFHILGVIWQFFKLGTHTEKEGSMQLQLQQKQQEQAVHKTARRYTESFRQTNRQAQ